MAYPLVSVIIATLGDIKLIKCALDSLKYQTFQDFDVIIVNQGKHLSSNEFDRCSNLVIHHYNLSTSGLSFARNYASGVALGKWLAYLDDDATYSNDFLEQALNLLFQHQLDGISGIVLDYKTHKPIARSLQFKSSQFLDINSFNLWMSSASIVSKKMAIEINGFDSNFGSAKRWGSNEESDFCLRLLHQKARLYFDSNLCVYHPSETEKLNGLDLKRIWRRGFSYGAGRGALIRKHGSKMPIWGFVQLIKMLLTAGLAVVQSILMIQLRYFLRDIASFCGRCYGFLMYK